METSTKVYIGAACAVVCLILVIDPAPFSIVGTGERGVLRSFGQIQGILEPGLHFRMPLVTDVVAINVQTTKLEIEKSECYSSNLQPVDVHSVINYNIKPDRVADVFKQYGSDIEGSVLRPKLEAVIKQTFAKFSAEQLLNKRAEVQKMIFDDYIVSVPDSINVTNYSLVNEAFSTDYENAIEAKQIAQQSAEKAQNDLSRVELEAKQRVAQANGEAEAQRIQIESLKQQGGENYTTMLAIQKWNGVLPTNFVPGSSLPFLGLSLIP